MLVQTLFDRFTVASLTIYLIHSEIFFLLYAPGFFKKMQIMMIDQDFVGSRLFSICKDLGVSLSHLCFFPWQKQKTKKARELEKKRQNYKCLDTDKLALISKLTSFDND